MTADLLPADYAAWLTDLKSRIHVAQQRATLAVNRELVALYWQLGRDILSRQAEQGWGAKVIDRLSADLRAAFPEMKGFSRANLLHMRAFAEAWPDPAIVQQAVGQLPWGHNLVLLSRLKDPAWRLAYAQRAIEYGWSRSVLNLHIETQRLEREGLALTNFDRLLPKPQSDLARESLICKNLQASAMTADLLPRAHAAWPAKFGRRPAGQIVQRPAAQLPCSHIGTPSPLHNWRNGPEKITQSRKAPRQEPSDTLRTPTPPRAYSDTPDFYKSAPLDEITGSGYILTVDLKNHRAESTKQEQAICKNLKELGYGK